MLKIISYSDSINSNYNEFIEYHRKFQTFIEINSTKQYPKNYSKIAALKNVVSLLENGYEGIVLFCDIDTRIIDAPTLKKVKDYDILIYCRNFHPANLSVLSGFLILNISAINREKLCRLVKQWDKLYHAGQTNWYSDQQSLAAAIMCSVVVDDLRVCNLNSRKGRITYFWSTIPWPFTRAFTHKGNDFYLSYILPRRYARIAKLLDLILIIPNVIIKCLQRFI